MTLSCFSRTRALVAALAVALLLLASTGASPTTGSCPTSTNGLRPVLWREPRRLNVQDWICGEGGCERAPAPPFRLTGEPKGGTNPKVDVRDAKGRQWSVKFGGEVIPECFGSRFVGAMGYLTEPTYYVAAGKIEGERKLKRARRVVAKDGTFSRARFQMRGQQFMVFLEHRTWAWNDNPFVGTRELAGLKILLMLLSNWDAADQRDHGDTNNLVFCVPGQGGPVLWYSMSDWGASLGRWGWALRRARSDCADFALDTRHFVRRAPDGRLRWSYSGKHSDDIKRGITVDDVRWLLPFLERVTPEELRAGLKASGATERQITCWSEAIRSRIRQLQAVAQ